MSFNGSGTFVINTAGQPVVANTVISATVFNALTADLATGLSTCITKDGQTTITANIPFGSNKITGLGAATAATDAATLGQVQSTAAKLITVTGTDTITGTMSPALTAYAAGQLFYFIANAANTGAMTINIDGLGAKAITRDGSTALIAGDVNTGEIVVICYDGTRFQMINAANSFGNTTINGTLTVTGNTGLQANVSITSTLSVGGTFAVTGAATLGSTLSVTGKSDLPVVSTASMNAAVAVITTGTVTNLTSTSASIASMNAGVALLTNATVTTLTATGASIASANIGNLQFTAASIASINAGVAVITSLTATGASIASMNAGVALLTTATVTNLTATGASIASANAGNLQVTGASVASANVGVALITTGTVTALTATGASIGSANVGTAVVTGLTVTNASIASANAGTATLSGNLTLNAGTANGVLYLNGSKVATSGSALTFDGTNLALTGTAPIYKLPAAGGYLFDASGNTGLYVQQISSALLGFYTGGTEQMRLTSTGLGIGTSSPASKLHVSNTAAATRITITDDVAAGRSGYIESNYSDALVIGTTSGVRGIRFSPDNTPRMYLDTSGNLGIGTSSPSGFLANKLVIATGGTANEGMTIYSSSNNGSIWFADATTGTGRYAGGLDYTHSDDTLIFYSAAQGNMRLNASGNLGLGVTPSAWGASFKAIQVNNGGATIYGASGIGSFGSNFYFSNDTTANYVITDYATMYRQLSGQHTWFTAPSGTAGNTITFTQAMTLDASGRLGIGETSPAVTLDLKAAQCRINVISSTGTNNALVRFNNTGGDAYIGLDSSGGGLTSAYALNIFHEGNYPITFSTNNTERARITSGGYFKASNTGSYVLSTGDYHELRQSQDGITLIVSATNASQTANVVEIYGARNTTNNTYYPLNYYNTGAAAYKFRVADSGDVTNTNGTYGTISDAKMKTDIVDAGSQWADIKALRFRKFKMKDDPSGLTQLGVVAQEVEQTSPGLVDEHADFEEVEVTDDEGNVKKERQPTGTTTKSVKTSILLMKAAVALQEAMARIEQLETKVAALESK